MTARISLIQRKSRGHRGCEKNHDLSPKGTAKIIAELADAELSRVCRTRVRRLGFFPRPSRANCLRYFSNTSIYTPTATDETSPGFQTCRLHWRML
jgi:hypothetical protein